MASENQNRLQNFKNKGNYQDEMRRRRNKVTIELRKKKREETILKRRNLPNMDSDTDEEVQLPIDKNLKKLAKVVAKSTQPEQQLAAIKAARELHLMDNYNLIYSNIITALVGCLINNDNIQVQFEAVCALNEIIAGPSEQATEVVAAGAVPLLIQLMSSPEPNVCEQAVWAIANLICKRPQLRDFIIEHGVLKPLISLIQPDTPISILSMVTRAFANMCFHIDPPPPATTIRLILPALNVLMRHTDTDILVDTLWAICLLGMGNKDEIQMIVESSDVKKMVTLLGHTEVEVQIGALRALGNIVSGTNEQKQVVLDCEALSYIKVLLGHEMEIIRKYAVFFLSNIAAGSATQVEAVFDGDLMVKILEILRKDVPQVKMHAAVILANWTLSFKRDGIFLLIRKSIMRPFCDSLACEDPEIIKILLTALNVMLKKAGKYVKDIAKIIEECDGLLQIEQLQYHKSCEIYQLAKQFLCTHFSDKFQPVELQPETTGQTCEYGSNSD